VLLRAVALDPRCAIEIGRTVYGRRLKSRLGALWPSARLRGRDDAGAKTQAQYASAAKDVATPRPRRADAGRPGAAPQARLQSPANVCRSSHRRMKRCGASRGLTLWRVTSTRVSGRSRNRANRGRDAKSCVSTWGDWGVWSWMRGVGTGDARTARLYVFGLTDKRELAGFSSFPSLWSGLSRANDAPATRKIALATRDKSFASAYMRLATPYKRLAAACKRDVRRCKRLVRRRKRLARAYKRVAAQYKPLAVGCFPLVRGGKPLVRLCKRDDPQPLGPMQRLTSRLQRRASGLQRTASALHRSTSEMLGVASALHCRASEMLCIASALHRCASGLQRATSGMYCAVSEMHEVASGMLGTVSPLQRCAKRLYGVASEMQPNASGMYALVGATLAVAPPSPATCAGKDGAHLKSGFHRICHNQWMAVARLFGASCAAMHARCSPMQAACTPL